LRNDRGVRRTTGTSLFRATRFATLPSSMLDPCGAAREHRDEINELSGLPPGSPPRGRRIPTPR
jgi:hypothetical protein